MNITKIVINCYICEINENEVRIFDAIRDGRMINICERCSIIENIPLIKIPNANQLKESESPSVSERMRQLTGINHPTSRDTFFQEDKLRELDSNPELELPEKKSLTLIENYHWEVMKNRRRKGLSQQQLAESLGESEVVIQMIEKAQLPDNAEQIINKLEQFYQISLKKIPKKIPVQKNEPILLDDRGNELDIIPEEEMVFIDEPEPIEQIESIEPLEQEIIRPKSIQKEPFQQTQITKETKDIDLKKINKEKVTIGELQELHKRKEEVTKQEKLEEQKKIEERQRILEALREKDKIKLEERKRQEALEKQQEEQERIKIIEEKKRELEEQKNQESKEVDSYLGGMELLEDEQDSNQNKNNDTF